jgi:hypothetical protein
MSAADEKPNHLTVAVITTAGTFPTDGFNSVPLNEPIHVEIEKADKALRITNTTGWVAKVGGKEIDINQTYRQVGLSGQVEIDWGKPEGGGGGNE